tara:strand:+ start:176 stop:574 length:399 start_codon:yes stop_codon:yes gene_type:complete
MDPKEKDILRKAMDVQYRYQLYNRPEFPFLPSMGIRDLFQMFGSEEKGFIGFLHLKYTHRGRGEKEWDSVWYDTPEEGVEVQEKWFEDVPYDRHILLRTHVVYAREQEIRKIRERKRKEAEKELEDKDILLN